jgi:DTW domain-containing protein YfiP
VSSTPGPPLGRATCLECFRPRSLCFCSYTPELHTRTRVVIVQHPREQFHSLGTARLIERSLRNSEVVRGSLGQLKQKLPQALSRAERPSLVFPSEDAVDVRELRGDSMPGSLVLLDGTWPQAKAILRSLPELDLLPKVQFTPLLASNYRIRRPPRAEYLSTLESIAEVLDVLEPTAESGRLRALFQRFIDENIAARAIGRAPPRRKIRTARAIIASAELEASKEQVLVVHTEKRSSLESSNLEREPRRQIWAARIAREGQAEFLPRFESFAELVPHIDPRDVVVSWSKNVLDELSILGLSSSGLCLKEAFCNLWQRMRPGVKGTAWGGLEAALEREGIGPALASSSDRALLGSILLWRRLVEVHRRPMRSGALDSGALDSG